jgi:Domain of unknown function (DUF4136)
MLEKVSVRPGRCFALRRSVLLSFILLSFAGLSAAKTTVDFDPQVDFSKYKTFGFIGGVGNLVMLELDPDFIYTRIHQNVVRELTKKGLQETLSSQKPDLVVRYWVAPESQVNVVAMGQWAPYAAYLGDYWGYSYNSVVSSNARVSNLIIDVIDAHTKNLVWRLYLSRKLADPEKDWKRIDDEFVDGFKNYPPSDAEKEAKRKERAAQKPAPASD